MSSVALLCLVHNVSSNLRTTLMSMIPFHISLFVVLGFIWGIICVDSRYYYRAENRIFAANQTAILTGNQLPVDGALRSCITIIASQVWSSARHRTRLEKLAHFCNPTSEGTFSSTAIAILICYDKCYRSKSKGIPATWGRGSSTSIPIIRAIEVALFLSCQTVKYTVMWYW
jgi:hypothetical protein